MGDFWGDVKSLGYTKAGFAKHIGVHRDTVSRWSSVPVVVELYVGLLLERRGLRLKFEKFLEEI